MGPSRTSALALSEFIAADSLAEGECAVWLKNQTWEDFDFPVLVKREIWAAVELLA
jgi:hypothetical protein